MVSYTQLIAGILLLPLLVQAGRNHPSQGKLRGNGRKPLTNKVAKHRRGLSEKTQAQNVDKTKVLERSRRDLKRRLGSKSKGSDCGKKGKKGTDEETNGCGGDDEIKVGEFEFIPQPSTITGTVYEDSNGNGSQDEGETGIPKVSIVLRNANGDEIDTLTSDENGYYEAIVPPDSTVIVEITESDLPTGSVQTEGENPTSKYMLPGETARIVGGFQVKALLEGHIYQDENKNGEQDGTDPDLSKVTVVVYDTTGLKIATAETDENGDYSIWLPPGEVTVRVDPYTLPFEFEEQTQGAGQSVFTLTPGITARSVDGFYVGPKTNDDKDVMLFVPPGYND